jgi:hypothetical protein
MMCDHINGTTYIKVPINGVVHVHCIGSYAICVNFKRGPLIISNELVQWH